MALIVAARLWTFGKKDIPCKFMLTQTLAAECDPWKRTFILEKSMSLLPLFEQHIEFQLLAIAEDVSHVVRHCNACASSKLDHS